MFPFFYDFFLHILALFYAPIFLFQWLFRGKYRKNIKQRLGIVLPRIRIKNKEFVVWFHAPSIGETKAIAPLVAILRMNMPNATILVSNVTETGHETALSYLKDADCHFYLPFDLPYLIHPIVDAIKPDLIIISETDFWYNFLKRATDKGARVVVVNGKISESSLRRFNFLPWIMAPLFQLIELICPQNEEYKNRFMLLGIPPDHLYVTGNLKLDEISTPLSEKRLKEWKQKLCLDKDDLLLVIGSTHSPEEKLLINVLKKVWKKYPHLKVAIAPRHPERFKTVATYLESIKIPFATYSLKEPFTKQKNLMLLDAMGVLGELYQVGDMAIVAGSYTDKIGGHHLLEPSLYGKPVLFGPHTHSQLEMAFMIKKAEAGRQVSLDKLGEAIVDLIGHPEKRKKMGAAGMKMFSEAKGATERTWQLLRVIISQILWEKEKPNL